MCVFIAFQTSKAANRRARLIFVHMASRGSGRNFWRACCPTLPFLPQSGWSSISHLSSFRCNLNVLVAKMVTSFFEDFQRKGYFWQLTFYVESVQQDIDNIAMAFSRLVLVWIFYHSYHSWHRLMDFVLLDDVFVRLHHRYRHLPFYPFVRH